MPRPPTTSATNPALQDTPNSNGGTHSAGGGSHTDSPEGALDQ
ncbi:hypothetical protein [Streptomyces sp. NPDC006463]